MKIKKVLQNRDWEYNCINTRQMLYVSLLSHMHE